MVNDRCPPEFSGGQFLFGIASLQKEGARIRGCSEKLVRMDKNKTAKLGKVLIEIHFSARDEHFCENNEIHH